MDTITFTKSAAPAWLLAMWKEIDDKTFGKGFDCFAENAVCNLGVADWHGREAIRNNLRQFIDKGLTAHHDVVEYWDSPLLKVFHGKVNMKFDDPSIKPVRPTMTHFFYMDEKDPTKVKHWIGSVGPTGFRYRSRRDHLVSVPSRSQLWGQLHAWKSRRPTHSPLVSCTRGS